MEAKQPNDWWRTQASCCIPTHCSLVLKERKEGKRKKQRKKRKKKIGKKEKDRRGRREGRRKGQKKYL